MYHSDWRALLAFSIGDEHAKCTAQFHICPPKILILITHFLRKADLELKISPPELKTKNYFKKKVALGNRAGVWDKRGGKPFIFVISPSIILVFLPCLYYIY